MSETIKHADIHSATDIQKQYALLKAAQPEIRARNAAEQIGVSEGELLAAQVGESVVRLADDAEVILRSVSVLGEVMALTRNDACVHERKGVYDNASFSKHGPMSIGLFVNPDIDLRLFMNHWQYQFAVTEATKAGTRKSLQFFNQAGEAVHKIYLTAKSDEAAFDKLVETHRHRQQADSIETAPYINKEVTVSDQEVDWPAFRTAWENLKDTHDFHPMLRKFKVTRLQAFQHIGEDFAYVVENNAARRVLDLVRDRECEMMVFVGNRGCIQIHTGPVHKLLEHGDWYNVMDPKFNLHLNEKQIASTWVTKKPTEDGIVTALEIFDADGEIIATFFGKRKPGIPELDLWRAIIAEIPMKQGVADAA